MWSPNEVIEQLGLKFPQIKTLLNQEIRAPWFALTLHTTSASTYPNQLNLLTSYIKT